MYFCSNKCSIVTPEAVFRCVCVSLHPLFFRCLSPSGDVASLRRNSKNCNIVKLYASHAHVILNLYDYTATQKENF